MADHLLAKEDPNEAKGANEVEIEEQIATDEVLDKESRAEEEVQEDEDEALDSDEPVQPHIELVSERPSTNQKERNLTEFTEQAPDSNHSQQLLVEKKNASLVQ